MEIILKYLHNTNIKKLESDQKLTNFTVNCSASNKPLLKIN
jgi:hypothetical protein